MADDDAKRLRLVELRSNNGFPRAVRFAPRLTLVTGFGSPERVGAWIAAALVGPRPDGVEGTVEVAGRAVALGDLPATLLPPRSSIVVADTDLEAARRRAVEPRYRRVVLRRQGAEADRAREEIARNTAASRFAALEHRLAELEPALADTIQRAAADEQRTQTMLSLRGLVAVAEEAAIAAREPDAEALALATEWLSLRAQRAELAAAHPHLSVTEAQRRVDVSEGALDQARQHRATADDVGRLYALQRAVNEASPEPTDEDAAVEGSDAREAALAAERDALRELGHTHASFLISVVAPHSDEDVRQAEAALAAAREELRQAQTVAALPTWPEIAQRQLDLRGRAAGVLGRFPGDDVADELRAFRPGAPALAEARAQLEAGLTTAGLDTEPDVEAAARTWIEEQERRPPVDHGPRLAELSEERETVETDLRSQAAELVAIAARLRDLDRRLDELAMQESRIAS
ncbi:MAG: hypothetical protein QOI55_2597, partial [Actinomycetota bacterium]|nr:hypothetical protein [Actinomycetota bacterium]